jgi:hypothetical protein
MRPDMRQTQTFDGLNRLMLFQLKPPVSVHRRPGDKKYNTLCIFEERAHTSSETLTAYTWTIHKYMRHVRSIIYCL